MKVVLTGHAGFIGQHLADSLLSAGHEVLGIDRRPARTVHASFRELRCDLLDGKPLTEAVVSFAPEVVLHLAAETKIIGRDEAFYRSNTDGTRNIATAALAAGTVKRFVHTSSRLVCEMGYNPKDDFDFCPPNLYGASKAESERIIRATLPHGLWLITRPTGIWGPGFVSPSYRDFFDAVIAGSYRNIQSVNPPKTFGYVKNTTAQMMALMDAELSGVQGRVFFLGDYEPIRVHEWAELIRAEAGLSRPGTIPIALVEVAAAVGSLLNRLGWKYPPMTRDRLRNLRTNAISDLKPIEEILPKLPYSVLEGTRETVEWILAQQGR